MWARVCAFGCVCRDRCIACPLTPLYLARPNTKRKKNTVCHRPPTRNLCADAGACSCRVVIWLAYYARIPPLIHMKNCTNVWHDSGVWLNPTLTHTRARRVVWDHLHSKYAHQCVRRTARTHSDDNWLGMSDDSRKMSCFYHNLIKRHDFVITRARVSRITL